MRAQLEHARAAYDAAQARRRTPEAAQARLSSRGAYRGLGRADALALGMRELAGVFAGPAFNRLDVPQGAHIDRLIDTAGAVIEDGGHRQLVESIGAPLTSRVGSGERDFVDLSLRAVDGGFAAVNPVVPVRIMAGGRAELSGSDLGVALESDQAIEAPLETNGRVFFANSLVDTDLVIAPTAGGVSFAFQVRSAAAPEQAALTVDLPAGARLRAGAGNDGRAVDIVGAGDGVLGRVLAPSGWDADGEALDVTYAVDRSRLVVRFPHRDRDLRYPLYVDPVVQTDGNYQGNLDGWPEWGFYASANTWNSPQLPGNPLKLANLGTSTTPHWYYQNEYASYSVWPLRGYISKLEGLSVTHNSSAITCAYMGILADQWAYWKPGAWGHCYSDPAPTNFPVVNNTDTAYRDWAMFQFKIAVGGNRWSEGSLTAAGVRVYLEDNEAPTVTGVTNSTNGAWVGPNTQVTVNPSAIDQGLGMRSFNLYEAGSPVSWVRSNGTASTNVNDACKGIRGYRCPNDRAVTGAITFNTNNLTTDGDRTLTGGAFDALSKQTGYTTVVRADTTGPSVSYGGELASFNGTSIAPGIYQLGITTSDRWSQVASVQMQVDAGAGWSSVPGPTPIPGAYGWNFDARDYARTDIERTVKVRALATDTFGNTSAPEITVSIKPSRTDPLTSPTTQLYAYGVGDHRQEALANQPTDVYANLKANYLSFIRNRFNAADCVDPTTGTSGPTVCTGSTLTMTFDDDVTAAAQKRIQLQPVLLDQPGNARVPDTKTKRKNFAAWAGRLATRYGPGGSFWQEHPLLPYLPILSWEIWNEPNSASAKFVSLTNGFPTTDYVDLLAQSKSQLRAAQPEARVVFGGLDTGENARTPYLTYLADVLDRGGATSISAVGIHPYAETPAEGADKVSSMRLALDFRGLANIQIWPGEIAWSVNDPNTTSDDRNRFTADTEAEQANNARELLTTLRQNRPTWKIGPIAWFSLRDDADRPVSQLDHFSYRTGLVSADYAGSLFDGTNRPAFNEMRTVGFNAGPLGLPPK